MFKNIGKKIKILAKTICIIQIVLFVIIGVVLMFAGGSSSDAEYSNNEEYSDYGELEEYYEYEYEENNTQSEGGGGVIAGLLVIVIGSLLAWISSFVLYGFGELIDKTCEIAANTSALELKNSNDLI